MEALGTQQSFFIPKVFINSVQLDTPGSNLDVKLFKIGKEFPGQIRPSYYTKSINAVTSTILITVPLK
jgi:hypothetical protein